MHVIKPTYKNSRSGIKVGTYTATVTSIEFDQEYADKEAFRIKYTLVDSEGTETAYSEVFHNNSKNERTAQFFEYLDDHGITMSEDDLPDIVGLRETVTLKKRAGYKLPVIVERSVLSEEESTVG